MNKEKKMKEKTYLPEGYLINTAENKLYLSSEKMLEKAMREEVILEGMARYCRGDKLELFVDLGCAAGIIPKNEAVLERDDEDSPKDIAIITRVGRPVCFVITELRYENGRLYAILSRRKAQEMCRRDSLSKLMPGDIIPCAVTHLDHFGAFVDIGCGIVSLLSVDCISVSRISHPCDRLRKGDFINAAVKSIDRETGRIYMTLRELLGTWEENAAEFDIGSTVMGCVRSIENYGIFVELSPNLAGLAEKHDGVEVGDICAVYIKNIIKERMKIKLSIIDSYKRCTDIKDLKYYIDPSSTPHISHWKYSPEGCGKIIETVFDEAI